MDITKKQDILTAIRAHMKPQWYSGETIWLHTVNDPEGKGVPGVSEKQGLFLRHNRPQATVDLCVSTARLQGTPVPSFDVSVFYLGMDRKAWHEYKDIEMVIDLFVEYHSGSLDHLAECEVVESFKV